MRLPLDLSGKCCIDALWKCVGPEQPGRGNRVLERCASPWQLTAIQKNRLSMRCYPNVKYASFKSTDANQSPGRIRARICLALASWTEAFQALCWWVRDLESGRVYPLSRHPKQRLDKNSLFAENCSIAPSPSNCIALVRIRAFRVSVRDYATPLKRGDLCLNWRVYPRSYAEQPAWDSWLLIASHALMNWHSGYSGWQL